MMLKIKSFLLALCLSPLSLSAFQLPVSAGGVSNAGAASGVINGSTGSFSTPTSVITPAVIVTPAQVNAVNAVINTSAPTTTITIITSAPPLATLPPAAQAAIAAIPTTGSSTVTVPTGTANGNVTVSTTPGTTTNGSTTTVTSSTSGSLGTLTAPTTTTDGSVTIGGVTASLPQATTPANASNASETVIIIILGGGNANQARMGGRFAALGARGRSVVVLVRALAGILNSSPRAANPLVPNLNASLLKSFDREKDFLLAQGKSQSVDPVGLAAAINAYNEVIDTSSPEVVANLSKDKEFIEVGQTLRKLRSAFSD